MTIWRESPSGARRTFSPRLIDKRCGWWSVAGVDHQPQYICIEEFSCTIVWNTPCIVQTITNKTYIIITTTYVDNILYCRQMKSVWSELVFSSDQFVYYFTVSLIPEWTFAPLNERTLELYQILHQPPLSLDMSKPHELPNFRSLMEVSSSLWV